MIFFSDYIKETFDLADFRPTFSVEEKKRSIYLYLNDKKFKIRKKDMVLYSDKNIPLFKLIPDQGRFELKPIKSIEIIKDRPLYFFIDGEIAYFSSKKRIFLKNYVVSPKSLIKKNRQTKIRKRKLS